MTTYVRSCDMNAIDETGKSLNPPKAQIKANNLLGLYFEKSSMNALKHVLKSHTVHVKSTAFCVYIIQNANENICWSGMDSGTELG